MGRGRFIALEGGEGVGKSTQAALLAERLRAEGYAVVLTREPGGTDGAEAIRDLLLHHTPAGGWTIEAEALLFAAARADHVARLIRPALERGEWVVCDRFVGSSLAYQGTAGGLGVDVVRTLHKIGSMGLIPDVTLVLELGAEARERANNRDGGAQDAIGGRDDAYHQKVTAGFRQLIQQDSGAISVEASGSPAAVAERIDVAVKERLA